MRRNQLVFFLIIGVAIAIIGIGFAIQTLTSDSGDGSDDGGDIPQATNAPDLTIEVAVNPLLETWVRNAATAYNATNPKVNGRGVSVRVIVQDSLAVWSDSASIWSSQNHPIAWIPDANYEIAFSENVGLRYEAYQSSLVETPLIWGGYQSRTQAIVNEFGDLNGISIQSSAEAERWDAIGGAPQWQFIKLAFARPNSSGHGLASLLMLAGEYADNPSLTSSLMSDVALQNWLKPIIDSVPNFSTLGADPAQTMATRGTSTVEIALLPESQWLAHFEQLSRTEGIQLFYSNNYVMLDFPYAIWRGSETTDDERRAAQAFGDFLLSSDQQRAAGELGFRPVQTGTDLSQFAPFNAASGTVQLNLQGSQISPADRPSTLSFLRWFQNYRTAP